MGSAASAHVIKVGSSPAPSSPGGGLVLPAAVVYFTLDKSDGSHGRTLSSSYPQTNKSCLVPHRRRFWLPIDFVRLPKSEKDKEAELRHVRFLSVDQIQRSDGWSFSKPRRLRPLPAADAPAEGTQQHAPDDEDDASSVEGEMPAPCATTEATAESDDGQDLQSTWRSRPIPPTGLGREAFAAAAAAAEEEMEEIVEEDVLRPEDLKLLNVETAIEVLPRDCSKCGAAVHLSVTA